MEWLGGQHGEIGVVLWSRGEIGMAEREGQRELDWRERERERDVLRRREKKCKQNRNKILAFVVRTVLMNSTVLKIELYGQKC